MSDAMSAGVSDEKEAHEQKMKAIGMTDKTTHKIAEKVARKIVDDVKETLQIALDNAEKLRKDLAACKKDGRPLVVLSSMADSILKWMGYATALQDLIDGKPVMRL